MADKQIMIYDTKKPGRKPWVTSQWTLNFYAERFPGRYKKFSDVIPSPVPVEEVGRRILVPDIPTIPKAEAVQKAKAKHPAAEVHKGNLKGEQVTANTKKRKKK